MPTMTNKSKIAIAKPYLTGDDIERVLKNARLILESGMMMQGAFVEKFERAFAHYVGVPHARAVNSGTSALHAILEYYSVRDSEVLVPVNTFLATSNAVLFAGGKPVFVEMDPETLCLDVDDFKRKITPKTKGIIVVHLAGLIQPRIEEIEAVCKERGLFLVEDASHAHGSSHKGEIAGSFGDAAAFSFLATKVITTGGEGGIVTTRDSKLASWVKSLRFHGEDATRGVQDRIGYSWRMTEIQAVVGLTQVERLTEIVSKRMAIAAAYDRAFRGNKNLKTVHVPEGDRDAYYKYPLILAKGMNRLTVKERLEKEFGVSSGTSYWPPCHLQPAYQKAFGYSEGMFPIAEDILSRTISLPMHCHLTDDEVARVIEAVEKVCE